MWYLRLFSFQWEPKILIHSGIRLFVPFFSFPSEVYWSKMKWLRGCKCKNIIYHRRFVKLKCSSGDLHNFTGFFCNYIKEPNQTERIIFDLPVSSLWKSYSVTAFYSEIRSWYISYQRIKHPNYVRYPDKWFNICMFSLVILRFCHKCWDIQCFMLRATRPGWTHCRVEGWQSASLVWPIRDQLSGLWNRLLTIFSKFES